MSKTYFIVGMPLSGKSTLVKALEEKLHFKTADTDDIIESLFVEQYKISKSIPEIFSFLSSLDFRNLERKALLHLDNEVKVISCGGGLPCYFDNIDYMRIKGEIIYLKEELDVLLSRNKAKPHPVYLNMQEEEIKRLINSRAYFFNKAKYTFGYDDCFDFLKNK